MYSVLNKLSEYIYTFSYHITLLHTLLLLVSKIMESLQCILKVISNIALDMQAFLTKIVGKWLLLNAFWFCESMSSSVVGHAKRKEKKFKD